MNATYLLDTNVIVNHIRGLFLLDPNIASEKLFASAITIGELWYGLFKSQDEKHAQDQLNTFLDKYPLEILPIDEVVMKQYAQTKAEFEKKGDQP